MAGPFLIGERVQLRPFEEEDAPILADWINDPDVRRYVLARFPKTIKDERDWLASMAAGGQPPRNVVFGVELRRDRRLIGSIGLHMIDWVQRRAMTGIFLYPAGMRGLGYGSEAKNLMLGYAFGELALRSLWAIAFENNVASMNALSKQGYQRSGVFRKATMIDGVWVDSVYFDILREEWDQLRKAPRPVPRRRPQTTSKRPRSRHASS